ncbi:hypothetical protein R1sor_005336 [Riccia sorocarpa]|uniref:Early light-induced protein n=1 Tax=Riccia sorocarpa TaxID=122646 RepID=A0ABD3HNM3_9MARC
MAASLSAIGVSAPACVGFSSRGVFCTGEIRSLYHSSRLTLGVPSRYRVSSTRCEAKKDDPVVSPSGVREAIDRVSKKTITKEAILENQETNESEQRSVFGAKPPQGSVYGRPEIERRPETGDKGFGSVFAFDGAAPETINGRAAMLGFVWAFLAEKATGLTVMEQLFKPGATGLVLFVGAVQLLTYATLVPISKGESTDARSFGPFTARAERWNGRLAMIGFAALIVNELIRQSPVFH